MPHLEDGLHVQAEIALEGKQHEEVVRPQTTALLGKLLLDVAGRCCGLALFCIVVLIVLFLLHAVVFSAVHLRYLPVISIHELIVSHAAVVVFVGVS